MKTHPHTVLVISLRAAILLLCHAVIVLTFGWYIMETSQPSHSTDVSQPVVNAIGHALLVTAFIVGACEAIASIIAIVNILVRKEPFQLFPRRLPGDDNDAE